VVICLERCADLHMAQLMPLPLTASCFSKIQIGFTFLVPAHPGSPGQRAIKRVCVCVCVSVQYSSEMLTWRLGFGVFAMEHFQQDFFTRLRWGATESSSTAWCTMRLISVEKRLEACINAEDGQPRTGSLQSLQSLIECNKPSVRWKKFCNSTVSVVTFSGGVGKQVEYSLFSSEIRFRRRTVYVQLFTFSPINVSNITDNTVTYCLSEVDSAVKLQLTQPLSCQKIVSHSSQVHIKVICPQVRKRTLNEKMYSEQNTCFYQSSIYHLQVKTVFCLAQMMKKAVCRTEKPSVMWTTRVLCCRKYSE